jgi:VCBS repeat-containing protein
MNNQIFNACRVPSLLLAAVLQFMPMVRAALPAVQTASNLFAIVFRWGATAAATLGGMQAVSGASTVITTGNLTATNGIASTNRLLTAPQTAAYYTASGLPPGINLVGVDGNANWKLIGVPTTVGAYNVNLTAKSSSTAPASETTTKAIVFTIVAGGGGGNSPPVATAQSVSTAEDTAKAIVLAGTDADSNPLTFAVVTAPAHGTLTGTAPNITYKPAANYNGADSFTFKANDGTVDCTPATVSITVTAANDAPMASAQSVVTDKNVARAITLAGSDVEGSPLTFTVVASPAKGVLSGTAPNLTYTPNLNATGADSFTFKANDGLLDSAAATVSITITAGPNTAPLASAQSATTAEDTAKAITLYGSDADGNPLTYAIVTPPTHGTLSGTAPNVTYTPALNFNGADSFTFRVNDGITNSVAATVSLTVTAVNDAPVAAAQSVATDKNVAKSITLGGSDAEASPLTFTVLTAPAKGALSGTAPSLVYSPNTNATGADSFTFKVNDGALDSATATASIAIAAGPNTTPIANAQNAGAPEDTATAITLTGSDADGNPLTYAIVTQPAHGTLSGAAPNVTYTPTLNYNGPDSFTFRVNDGVANSTAAAVAITVSPVNDAPVANAQSVVANQKLAKAITLAGSDVDGNALTYTVVTQPAHGTLSGTPPGVVYSAQTNYTGPDSFTFQVNDGAAGSAPATVAITVTAPDALPLVSVLALANASEPKRIGSFLFTRTGDLRKSLAVNFELDGTATPGVDYFSPGSRLTFSAGRSNATVLIKPIADRLFEGAKTVVLTVTGTTNYDAGEPETASILIGDDDRPKIAIAATREVEQADDADKDSDSGVSARPGKIKEVKVGAAAIPGFSLVLQSSTDMVHWTVVSAPPLGAPVVYPEPDPMGAPARFYRTLYVFGEVTETSIADALTYQLYCANIVGLVNVTIRPGWNLVANPLNGLPQDGPIGELPDGTVFAAFKSSKPNTYDDGKWSRGMPLTRSTPGGWIFNPGSGDVTVTFVGEVPDPSGQPRMASGWSVRSSPVDTVVGNDSILGYPLYAGDALYEFNPAGVSADIWIPHFRGVAGWDSAPELRSGQGVLIYKNKSAKPGMIAPPTPPVTNFIKLVPADS